MRVELLGTGGYYANNVRHTACMLFPEWGIVFDAGSALFRTGGRIPGREMHLFVTHPHLDHIVGLPYLLLPILRHELDRVALYATADTLAAVENHLLSTPLFPVAIPFELVKLGDSGTQEVAPQIHVRWQSLPSHPGGSMAFRVDNLTMQKPVSVAYVTDTCVDGSYSDFIRGVDLLIHECNFPDERAEIAALSGHSIASDVARLAAEAGVGSLVVVHVDAASSLEDPIGIPAMRRLFPRVQLGVDGMSLEVSSS